VSARQIPAAPHTADAPAWTWPIYLSRYDRRGMLTEPEANALRGFDLELVRRDGLAAVTDPASAGARLARPLADAIEALYCPADERDQRRYARDAAALVLLRCGELRRAYWGWSPQDWIDLIGAAFRRRWPGQIGANARAFLIAFAYLLGDFTSFEQFGRFRRVPLARRVFGAELVEDAVDRLCSVLAGWGYSRERGRFASVIVQALLLNRSPLLQELSAEALVAMRTLPATDVNWPKDLCGIHRAITALGHVEAPPRPRHTGGPAKIEGTAEDWAQLVERWYATSMLSPKIRAGYCSVLAKVGRWLVAEHPQVTDPAQWNSQVCASWVAAVDRMAVGDYSQWTEGMRA
jgi:hypothetical protein